ncbi:MAG: PAS domain S-box protein [Asgard group archaeon]|nr:PAS domain S-box protein [Asgard group archaeon]
MKETSDKSFKKNIPKKKSNDSEEKKNSHKELEKTKKELEALQSRFNSLFEKTNDAIILMDLETRVYRIANQKATELFGFKLEDIHKLSASSFIFEEESSDSLEKLEELKKGKILPVYVRKFRKNSGEIFHGEVNLSLVEDPISKRTLIQSIVRDITIRKHAELNLERDRLIFQKIANAAIQTTDVPEFCNKVLSDLLEHLDFDIGTLRIFDLEKELLTPLAVLGLPQDKISELRPMKLTDDQYIISQAIITREPLFAPDVSKIPELKKYKSRLELFNIKALISWPILDKDKNILGALQLSARNPKSIPDEDRSLFESITIMLANALERFNAEKALEKAFHERKEINQIIEMSPAIIFLWRNEKGWPVDYVTNNVHILGYSPEDFYSGKISYRDLIFEEDVRVENVEIDLYSQKEYPYEFPIDYRIRTKSGEIKWVLEYSTPRKDINGDITHYHGIILDITERKKQEESLIEAYYEREELDTIINLSPAIVFLWRNAEGWPVEYASDNVGVFGYTPEDFYSGAVPYSEIVYPEDLERVAKEVEEFSKDKNRQTFTQEYRIITKTGDIRWTFDYTSIRRDEAGNITHFHGIILDTTDQKKTEESLIRAYNEREELDRTINLSPAVVFLWRNAKGWPVEFVSDNVALFGYSPEEFYSEKLLFADIIHPSDLQKVIDEEQEYLQNKDCREYVMEYRILSKNGDARWIYNYNAIRRDSEGNVTHFQGIILDTTDSKKAEDSLRNERKAFQIIADAAAEATTLPELCQWILNGLIETLGFDVGSIRLYNEEEKLLEPVANVQVETITGQEIQSIPIDSPDYINALVARTKTAIFAPDIIKHDIAQEYIERLKQINLGAVITWPILNAKNELLGILQLAAHVPKEIPEEDQIVFETITGTLTNAIERLIAEEARRESEERLRAFAEQSLTGVLLFTKQGEILFANKQMEKITEYPLETMLQTNAFEYLVDHSNDDTEDILKLFQSEYFVESESPTIREFNLKTRTGKTKWLSISITPIEIRDEVVYAAMVVDISEQKNAQLALSRERSILELISEATANNLSVKDLCEQILEGIIKILDVDSGTIRFFDKKEKKLLPFASYGIVQDEEYMITPISIDDEKYPIARFAKNRRKIFVLDAQKDDFLKNFSLVKKHKYQTYISWPIVNAANELLGMMQLGSRKITNLSEQDKTFFDTITNIIGTAIEHLQVLENLKDSEERFKKTVDTSLDGITIVENNIIVYANERVLEIYGYPREEYMKMSNYVDMIQDKEKNRYHEEAKELSSEQRSITVSDFWINRYDGTKRFVRNKVYVAYGDGESYNLYIATSDLTDGKIAEDSLIRERLVFKLVAEIALFSKDIVELNEKMIRSLMDLYEFDIGSIRLYDKTSSMLVLSSEFGLTNLLGGDPKPVHISDKDFLISKVARDRKSFFISNIEDSELEERLLERTRRLKIRSLVAFPIISDNNELIGTLNLASYKTKEIPQDDVIFFENIIRLLATAIRRTQVEKELRELNEELELRVQQRTSQLLSVNKELEAFSYSVSHDLRTPLRSIDGFSQALLEDYTNQLDETGKDYLTRVRSACKRMSNLIDDILSLSRLTRKDMDLREINLSELANNIISEFQENEPDRKVKVKVEDNVKVLGDSTLIRTIMENLLGNAWKFTSKKQKARIDFGRKIINNEEVYYIQDDGVGFDAAYADKLFAVFQRLHTYTEFKGTGIGLAIVQRIVNRHGGRIWAESEVGKGATFYFTLPKEHTDEEIIM